VVLSILARGESYGYAIICQVRELSQGEVMWTDGMLYPVLHRLERQGLIESYWGVSETGRKRKYYRLCKEGSQVLEVERQHWRVVDGMLNKLWKEETSCLTDVKPNQPITTAVEVRSPFRGGNLVSHPFS
jgi:DNA-binding PadR family transcriptional regulator